MSYGLFLSLHLIHCQLRQLSRWHRLDAAPLRLIFFETTGTLVDGNAAFLKMTGYTRADVASHTLTWQKMTRPNLSPSARRNSQGWRTGVGSARTTRNASAKTARAAGCVLPAETSAMGRSANFASRSLPESAPKISSGVLSAEVHYPRADSARVKQ